MTPIVLELPWPPSINLYWRRRQGQHRLYLTKRAQQFRKDVFRHVLERAAVRNLKSDLRFEMDLYPPTRRRYDADNFLKGAIDALMFARVFEDDSQLVDINVCKRDVYKGGKAIVRISEV